MPNTRFYNTGICSFSVPRQTGPVWMCVYLFKIQSRYILIVFGTAFDLQFQRPKANFNVEIQKLENGALRWTHVNRVLNVKTNCH
jgi:hypothetical protein